MVEHPHERLIQTLSTLLIQLNALKTVLMKEPAEALLTDLPAVREGVTLLEQMAREALDSARALDDDLPPPELEGITLAEALSRLTEETAETLGLSSRVSFNGVDEQGRPKEHVLSTAAERVLYFVAREALYQLQQHVGTRKLRLVLTYGNENVQMSIEDDGILAATVDEILAPPFGDGHTESDGGEHRELRPYIDLRSRIEYLGGSLELDQQSEQGTRVLASIPYEHHIHEPSVGTVGTPFIASAPLTSTTLSAASATPATSVAPLPSLRVLVVESQAVTRAGLRRLLETYTDLQVIGEAADGVQAVSETLELGPQVVLMDSQLPGGQSMEALRQIKQLNLETKVLLLSTQDHEEYLYETLRAGADGYVLKDIAPDELAQAIRVVASGEVLVQPRLAGRLLSRVGKQGRGNPPYESLTTRELEVLRLLARGLRNKEIAARLYVSERTVNFHLANIYQKLNVSGRTEALSKALDQGLIPLTSPSSQ